MTVEPSQAEARTTTPLYFDADDITPKPPPGHFPYTRGPYAGMYRDRLWTMRQYAGFGTAAHTNVRFKYLLEQGQTGLSVAFDLPTQMGLDSDNPRSQGEVGRVGVAIDTLADMEELLAGIPLDEVSTSMTINATAACLLLLYEIVADKQHVPGTRLHGTVQNDILKEYAARGTYIYPPVPSMRLATDLMAYANDRIPNWNTISISGYHIREAGSTAAQEVAFTLANGIAYVEAAIDAGLDVDTVAPRFSFFFNAHNNILEEVAKFRAARQLWAEIMRNRFGADNPRSCMLRFHAQTGGSTLTAQQPLNNVVRVALQALAAVLGGTQSLHTNAFDEALALPSEASATLALRTQQIIGYESGATAASDPLGGSYYVEHLTDKIAESAKELMQRIDSLGGAVCVVQSGWMQGEIEDAAYRYQRALEESTTVVVGVNRFVQPLESPVDVLVADPQTEAAQIARLERVREERDTGKVRQALRTLEDAARGTDNLLYPMKEALAAYASIGEVSESLHTVFGSYQAA